MAQPLSTFAGPGVPEGLSPRACSVPAMLADGQGQRLWRGRRHSRHKGPSRHPEPDLGPPCQGAEGPCPGVVGEPLPAPASPLGHRQPPQHAPTITTARPPFGQGRPKLPGTRCDRAPASQGWLEVPRWGLGPRHPSKRVAALAAGTGSNAGSRDTRRRGRIASLGLLATLPVPQAGAEMSLGQGCSPGVAAPAPHLWASIAALRESRRTPGVWVTACSLLTSFSYRVSREQGETRARCLPQTSARDVTKPAVLIVFTAVDSPV